jgi:hypothetical protein
VSRGVLWASLLCGALLSVLVSYRMATQSLVLGSSAGRWTYVYLYGFSPRSLVVCFGAALVCSVVAALPPSVTRRYEWWVVALWLVLALTIQLRLRLLAPYPVERIFASDGANGFYGATHQYRAPVLLRDFDRLRPTLSIHPRSNMPGKLMLVYLLERLSQDPRWLSWFVIAISNLGGVFLYLIVRDVFHDQATALLALVFYLFVPAKIFFFPVLNTVTPAVMLCCLYLWITAVRTRAIGWAAALGASLFGLLLFEPLPFVTGVLFLALAGHLLLRSETDGRVLVTRAGWTLLTFAAAYMAARVVIGVDAVAVFRHVWNDAVAFNAEAGRPYRIWVWRNLIDFSIGTGLCQMTAWAGVVVYAVWHAREWRMWGREPVVMFSVGVAATVLATDLLGVNRGETVRLWIFLACLAQVPAAYACARLESRVATALVLATSVLSGTIGTSMFNFAQP